MAKPNNDAREILCNMVTQKAADKRKKLSEALKKIDEEVDAAYSKRITAACKEIEPLVSKFKTDLAQVLTKHHLEYKVARYCDRKYTFDELFERGGLRETKELRGYLEDKEKKSDRKSQVEAQLEELDARVTKAKQEILLRAALGMKYDEVVAIVNKFQF